MRKDLELFQFADTPEEAFEILKQGLTENHLQSECEKNLRQKWEAGVAGSRVRRRFWGRISRRRGRRPRICTEFREVDAMEADKLQSDAAFAETAEDGQEIGEAEEFANSLVEVEQLHLAACGARRSAEAQQSAETQAAHVGEMAEVRGRSA